MKRINTIIRTLLGLVFVFSVPFATAQEETQSTLEEVGLETTQANSLDELLKLVEERRIVESAQHVQREREFLQNKADQQKLLNDAKAEQARQERRGEQLETRYENNEVRIGDLQELLDKRLGTLRELFGVFQGVAGDTRGKLETSIVAVQLPNRGEFLDGLAAKMGAATELASIEELEHMWFLMQQQMTEASKIAKFTASVDMISGDKVEKEIIRVGDYNLVTDDGYINFDISLGKLTELARQPSAEFTNTAEALYEAEPGEVVAFAVDPTHGSLLQLEIQRATLGEMVGSPFGGIASGACYLPFCDGQGGVIGAIIILVGIVGVLLAFERLITLSITGGKVARQKANPDEPDSSNPLGRVIGIYHNNRNVDSETLQLKMGEAVLAETPSITRNITIVQVISVVAPLMGLLGTVIGMIQTFQAITLYGTGDPKIMASGISTALMTTVLGLCVAIPTVLLHSLVNQRSRSVLHVLDEQSEGIIAQHAEEAGKPIE